MMPNDEISTLLHPIAEQLREQSERIRQRAEWIDAARRRLWERMDRLREWQRANAARQPGAVHLPGLRLASPEAPADPE